MSRRNEDYVVLSDCDGVFRMDLSDVVDYHEKKQADITLVCHKETIDSGLNYEVVKADESGRVTEVRDNASVKGSNLFYINVMVINRPFLLSIIEDSVAHGYRSFHEDILQKNTKGLKIYAYEFKGYHVSVDSLSTYFKHNMELLDKNVRDELFGARDIYTKVRDSAPSKFGSESGVKNSLISDGCVVEGTVENSILFRGVKIGKGAVIKNSIIMQDSVIGEKVITDCVITDKNVVIRDNRILAGCDVQPYFIPKGTMI